MSYIVPNRTLLERFHRRRGALYLYQFFVSLSIYPANNTVLLMPALMVGLLASMTFNHKPFGIAAYVIFYLTASMVVYATTIYLMLYPKKRITKLDIKIINIALFCTAFVAIFLGILSNVGIETDSLSPMLIVIGCFVFAVKLALMTIDYFEARHYSDLEGIDEADVDE